MQRVGNRILSMLRPVRKGDSLTLAFDLHNNPTVTHLGMLSFSSVGLSMPMILDDEAPR